MRYAIISDIHANLPALEAVLADARSAGADRYLFLGDMITDQLWANEVLDTIRALPGATVILGNREGYVLDMLEQDRSGWTCDMLEPLYYTARTLRPDNAEFLRSLPTSAREDAGDAVIHLDHVSPIFFRKPDRIECFHSSDFLSRTRAEPFSHAQYLAYARERLLERDDAIADIEKRPEDALTFGHNHMQWHGYACGKLLLNPGSGGSPCDCDTTAAYTVLERAGGRWTVDERRVPYDAEAAVSALVRSEIYEKGYVWCNLCIHIMRYGEDLVFDFFEHLAALRGGERSWPPDNDVTLRAAKTFYVDLSRRLDHRGV